MSYPRRTTIFGKIIIDNKTYDLLSHPFGTDQSELVTKYLRENNCGSTTAPWHVNRYNWLLEDNILYLTSIRLLLCDNKENIIEDIFDTSKLKAAWLNKKIKVLIDEIKEYKNPKKPKEKKRHIMLLTFLDGILVTKEEMDETYITIDYLLD